MTTPCATPVDYFSLHTRKNKKITLDMLDYGYVAECADIDELKGILATLKSGTEGKYPMLERATEERILAVLPVNERSKIKSMRSGPTQIELESEEEQLSSWTIQIDAMNNSILGQKFSNPHRRLPPVRGQQALEPHQEGTPLGIAEPTPKIEKRAIPAYDFRAWEKYDVDKALDEIEERDQQVQEQSRLLREKKEKRERERKRELASLPSFVDLDAISQPERKVLARLEKEKGNDCFKANENEEAVLYYTRSIAFDDSDAVLYSNRAAAYLRVKNFAQAEEDCSRAIQLDPFYCKAWKRRGMTRFRRGKYAEAIEDFEHSLKLEPASSEVEKLLKKTIAKRQEVNGAVGSMNSPEQPRAVTGHDVGDRSDAQRRPANAPKSFTRFEILEDDDKDTNSYELTTPDERHNSKPFQRFEIIED